MDSPPLPSTDSIAYLLIELHADGNASIQLQGDPVLLRHYLLTALSSMPTDPPREAA